MTRRGGSAAAEPERIVVALSWAAEQLGVSIETARRLARAGDLPGAFQVGTLWRVSTVQFRRQVDERAAANRAALAAERLAQAPESDRGPTADTGGPNRSQSHRGRQIAASSPKLHAITGDTPAVRRRRSPQENAQGESS